MLFRRREKATLWERFKLWLWPRVSWRRSGLYYLKRILRLSGTPYAIAMGSAIGVFVCITPFIGFHFVITLVLAWLLRGNMIAGAIATAIGNPITYPVIWAGTYEVGQLILRGRSAVAPARLPHELWYKSIDQIIPLVKPMVVGSIPIGLAGGCIAYFIVYKAVAAYQKARRERIAGGRLGARAAEGSASLLAGSEGGSP